MYLSIHRHCLREMYSLMAFTDIDFYFSLMLEFISLASSHTVLETGQWPPGNLCLRDKNAHSSTSCLVDAGGCWLLLDKINLKVGVKPKILVIALVVADWFGHQRFAWQTPSCFHSLSHICNAKWKHQSCHLTLQRIHFKISNSNFTLKVDTFTAWPVVFALAHRETQGCNIQQNR